MNAFANNEIPAFPCQPLGSAGMPLCEAQPGMSLRDYLAAAAMPIAAKQEAIHSKYPSYAGTAYRAYQFADAMLAERSK